MKIKVVLACWSFLQHNCLAMILQFWSTSNIAHQTTAGVLKHVPKKAGKRRLKDWRPLAMMPIIYKMIAKLLAEHFSPYSSKIISV